jgi:exosortase/archaeosortase
MSAEVLSVIAGVILTLGFSYIPGLRTWYAEKSDESKQLIMLVLLLIAAGASFGLACLGWGAAFGIALACTVDGALGLFYQVVLAIIANQAVYGLSPQRKDVRALKNGA